MRTTGNPNSHQSILPVQTLHHPQTSKLHRQPFPHSLHNLSNPSLLARLPVILQMAIGHDLNPIAPDLLPPNQLDNSN